MRVACYSQDENEAAATQCREHPKPGMNAANNTESSMDVNLCDNSYEDADCESFNIESPCFVNLLPQSKADRR